MAISYNDESLIQSHEYTLTRDDKGMWSGVQTFHCKTENLALLVPAKGSVHPDYAWMAADAARVTGEEGGWCRVEVDYYGYIAVDDGQGGEEPPAPSYVLDLSVSEEPLESDPYFDDLDADDIQEAVRLAKSPKVDDDGVPVPAVTTGWDTKKVKLYDALRSGWDSVRDPKATWTEEWVSDSMPDDLNDIGKIFSPAGGPPTVAAGRNWLMVGLQSRKRGLVYENTRTAELSGRGGWDTDVYGS